MLESKVKTTTLIEMLNQYLKRTIFKPMPTDITDFAPKLTLETDTAAKMKSGLKTKH